MSNEIEHPGKPPFDYEMVSQDQAMQLREISVRLGIRVQRTAEEMLAMGADLRDAKRICKEDGTLFTAWCESVECPVSYITANRLMSVHSALGNENNMHVISSMAFGVISAVTQTRDEDIRQALLEHLKDSADNGEKVTQKEITAIKKALTEAQAKAAELEDEAFNARQSLEQVKIERDKAKAREKEAREKKEQFAQDLIEADKQRKAIERDLSAKLKDQQQALKDAEEVHREHLDEMRRQIVEQERNRPRTDAEEQARQAKLNELNVEMHKAQTAINQATKEKSDLEKALMDLRKESALRDRVLNDWGTASIGFREVALRLSASADALKKIPITDELYTQIKMIRELSVSLVAALDGVTHVG